MRCPTGTPDQVPSCELAAKPVPELRKAPKLRDDETTDWLTHQSPETHYNCVVAVADMSHV